MSAAPQVSDAARLALLNASSEASVIEIIASHGLSPLAQGRVADALSVIRAALRLERLACGMAAPELRRAG